MKSFLYAFENAYLWRLRRIDLHAVQGPAVDVSANRPDARVDIPLPSASLGASIPSSTADVALPSVPSVSGDVSASTASAEVTLPSGSVDLRAPAVGALGKCESEVCSGFCPLPSYS